MGRRGIMGVAGVLIAFIVVLVALGVNEAGVPVDTDAPKTDLAILSREEGASHVKVASAAKDTLIIWDSNDDTSVTARTQLAYTLGEMRVGYDECDLKSAALPDLSRYGRVVSLASDPRMYDESFGAKLAAYVDGGGALMIGVMPYELSELQGLADTLGITQGSSGAGVTVSDFKPSASFMVGGGGTYKIEDPEQAALGVTLTPDCEVEATTGDGATPLVWERSAGRGRVVVCNMRYYERATQGIFSSAFALLKDATIWPVIDASIWWLDDWPSPVPQGDGQYIQRDYHMSISEFYSRIWWPDVLQLSQKHHFAYSGAIIETYEARTSGELPGSFSTDTYLYFGNQLLNSGGEIGYHGYNHQPLVGPGYRYAQDHGYVTWESVDEMSDSISELERFTKGLYEGVEPIAYVPPSNILSKEGRQMLASKHPEIRAIASTYFTDADAYTQDFTVAADGEIEMPRIVSGANLDDYMKFAALSELNLHYVNSHFMHPDDLLDVDRGAAIGWEKLKQDLDGYMDWIDASAPQIAHVTASGMAARVQRYANATPEVTVDGSDVRLHVDGFFDKAWFMMRSAGAIASVDGGSAQRLADGLYLIEADQADVTIHRSAS